MLKPGDRAPEFLLPDADMKMAQTSDFLGKNNLVLFFYSKDDNPACAVEAVEFSDLVDDFGQLDTLIFGINNDTCLNHGEFSDKYGLSIRLLADPEAVLCEACDVMREKEIRGEIVMRVIRSTFVIDKAYMIRHALYDVKPKGHAKEVLELVKKL